MEKINIAELLRDCPKGMELDCTINNDVKFIKICSSSTYPIILRTKNGYEITLTKYGQVHNMEDSKCVIFPKGKTTWEGFVPPIEFKDGDVVVDEFGIIFLYKQIHTYYKELYADFYCGLSSRFRSFMIKTGEKQHCGKMSSIRYATEEEKQKLFDTIRDRGYKWNPETKTLQKFSLEKSPMFKVGDRIKVIYKEGFQYDIKELTDAHYILEDVENKFKYTLPIIEDKNWELVVPNKFDITKLKPFDKVLVRDFDNETWEINFFSKLLDGKHFKCLDLSYVQCIPYKGNERLYDTTNKCDEFYITWKNE